MPRCGIELTHALNYNYVPDTLSIPVLLLTPLVMLFIMLYRAIDTYTP